MLNLCKRVALALLLTASSYATTLTGTLNGPNGTGITGKLVLALSQQGALKSTGGCGGPLQVVPGYQVSITVTAGALVSPPAIYGNDCMLPSNLYYLVQVYDSNGNQLMSDRWVISGTTVNIGTIVSAVISGTTTTLGGTGLVLQSPSGNQTINQPVGSALSINLFTVTGTLTFPNGATCDSGGCASLFSNTMTTNTAQSISGLKTFNNHIVASLSNNYDLGDKTEAWRNIFVQQNVFAGSLWVTNGTFYATVCGNVICPTDFFTLTNPGLHVLQILDSSSSHIAEFNAAGGYPTSTWTWIGSHVPLTDNAYTLGTSIKRWASLHVEEVAVYGDLVFGSGGNLYSPVYSGSDVSCAAVTDGWMSFNTSSQQLHVCISGTLYRAQLVP